MAVSCPLPKYPVNKRANAVLGRPKALATYVLNNQQPLDRAPNGEPSKLFDDIMANTGDNLELAIKYKAEAYSDLIRSLVKTGHIKVDENGEPLYSELDDLYGISTVDFKVASEIYVENRRILKANNQLLEASDIDIPLDSNKPIRELINRLKSKITGDNSLVTLLETIDKLDLPVNLNVYTDVHNTRRAMYYSGNTININAASITAMNDRMNGAISFGQALAHELIHAVTINVLKSPRNSQERALAKQIKDLYDKVKDKSDTTNLRGYYGLTSEYEFVSELMSNSKFRAAVTRVTDENTNVWRRLINSLFKFLFGRDLWSKSTEVDEAYDAIMNLMSTPKKFNVRVEGTYNIMLKDLYDTADVDSNKHIELIERLRRINDKIFFDDDTHTYWQERDGELVLEYTSATTAIDEAFGDSGTINDAMIRGGNIGSVVHKHIEGNIKELSEDLIKEMEKKSGIKMTPEASFAISEIIKKFDGENITILSEVRVADPIQKLAGTIDMVVLDKYGRAHLYDFKTSANNFKNWNTKYQKGDSETGNRYSSSDRAHLQLSVYREIFETNTGIMATTLNVVLLNPKMEGDTIVDVGLSDNVEEAEDGIITYRESSGLLGLVLKPRENKNGTTREKADFENEQDEAEFLMSHLLSNRADLNKVEKIYNKVIQALKRKKRILEKRGELTISKELSDRFLRDLLAEEDANKGMIMLIKNFVEVINNVKEEVEDSKANNTITALKLRRWLDSVVAYDELDGFMSYIEFTGDIEVEGLQELKEEFQKALNIKNEVKHIYEEEGVDLIAEYLAPYYNGIYASKKYERSKQWTKLSKEVKDKLKNDKVAYVNSYMEENKEQFREETKELIRTELRKARKDVNVLYRWMDNMLDTRDIVSAGIVQAFARADEESRMESMVELHDLLTVVRKFEDKFKPSMFKKDSDLYNFMLEKDDEGKLTGTYITKIKKQAFDDYREMISIVNELNNPTYTELAKRVWKDGLENIIDEKEANTFNVLLTRIKAAKRYTNEEYQEFVNKYFVTNIKTGESKGWLPLNKKDRAEALVEYLTELKVGDEITQGEFSNIRSIYDPRIPSKYTLTDLVDAGRIREEVANKIKKWLIENTWQFREPVKDTKDGRNISYYNKQWDVLQAELAKDPVKKEFYDYIVEVGKRADRLLPAKFKLYNRLPGVVKQTNERIIGDGTIGSRIVTKLQQDFTLRPEDVDRGTDVIQDSAGNDIYFLPVHYMTELPVENQSFDLPTIYYKYLTMAIDNNIKSRILPELEMAKGFVSNRKTKRNTGKLSTILTKVFNRDDDDYKDGRSNIADQLDDWFKAVVYGKLKNDGPVWKVAGVNISPVKILDAVNKYTALNLLGFNFIQGTANVLLGETMQAIETYAKQYIDTKSYTKASTFYVKHLPSMLGDIGLREPTAMASILIRDFDVLNDYTGTQFRRNTKFRQLMTMNSWFFISQSGEHMMQSRFLFAMLEQKRAYNSKGEDIGSMLDMYEKGNAEYIEQLKEKYGDKWSQHFVPQSKLSKEVDIKKSDWTEEDIFKFKQKAKGILSGLHGEYSDLGKVAIQRYALGRMAYMFRKFIIPGFKRRWQILDYNERLGEMTEGNYTTFLRFAKQLYKDGHMFKLQLLREDFNALEDFEKANIRRTIGEITMFITAVLILKLLTSLDIDGGDDDDKRLYNALLYIIARYKTELAFFVNPYDAMAILRSPAASMSVLENILDVFQQLLDPLEVYDRGPNKGTLKLWKETRDMIPFYRQIYRYRSLDSSTNWFLS